MTSSKDSSKAETKQIFLAVFVCFFLSGSAGLVYQIIWTRMLSLVFGSTTLATSTVLATFMAGLALGSYLFGRLADRMARLLQGYAILEIGVGVYALLVPAVLKLAQPLYLAVARSSHFSSGYNIFLFFLSFTILFIPTVLMGGTLPILSKFFIRRPEAVGRLVGNLYAVNTFGAVLGILAAGYLLLPVVGMTNLILMAAVLNIGIGLLCYIFDRHLVTLAPQTSEPVKTPAEKSRLNLWAWLILIGFAVSGFTSMVYEIAWTRTLALSIGSSIYAFSIMLLTFIFGIAAGSLIFSMIWKERRVSYYVFALLEVGIAFVVLLFMPLFDRLPVYFLNLLVLNPTNYSFIQFTQFLLCFLVMIVPALLFGASFPIVSRILVLDLNLLGSRIGQAYSVNTVGCILGSFMTGFVLIPLIGAQAAIIAAAFLNLLVALTIFAGARTLALPFKAVFALLSVVLIVLCAMRGGHWDRVVLSTGVSVRPADYLAVRNKASLEEYLKPRKLVFYREGVNCNVAVIKTKEHIALNINGKTDASSGGDMATQLMSGYLPLILHHAPKDVFILGLGSGITMGACVQYGVPNIECAEIEDAVIEGARFFARENHDVVAEHRDKIFAADGRNYLLASKKKYDVISTEPSNPWMAGIANLFAKEFYEICRDRLKPGGIICQWVQGYNLAPEDFQMIITTFRSVFPHVMVWSTLRMADYLLIGSFKSITFDVDSIARRMAQPAIQSDLKLVSIDNPYSLLSCLVLTPEGVNDFVKDGIVNSDNLPLLEFSAPRSLFRQTSLLNDAFLRRYEKPIFSHMKLENQARINYYNALHLSLAGFAGRARAELDFALAKDSTHFLSYLNRAMLDQMGGQVMAALNDLRQAIRLNPRDARIYQTLGRIYEGQGRFGEALANYEKAIELDPGKADYRLDLINLQLGSQSFRPAIGQCEAALAIDSLNSKIYERLGFARFMNGDTSAAVLHLERAVILDEFNGDAFYRLGTAYAAQKNNLKALENLRKAKDLEPMRIDVRLNLGGVYANLGMKKEAAREFKRVLRLDPENFAAFYNLRSL